MTDLTTTTTTAKKEVFKMKFMDWTPTNKEIKLISKKEDSCYFYYSFEVVIQSPCNSSESLAWNVAVSFDKFDGTFNTNKFQLQNRLNN